MPPTRLKSQILGNDGVLREDLNITIPGSSVITRLLNGGAFSLSSTGADSGTGDVTLSLAATGIAAAEYVVTTFGVDGRATSGRALLGSDLPSTGIGTGTATKVTYDDTGRITGAASLAAGDLPSGSTFYVQNQSGSAQTASAWVTGFMGASALRAYNGAGTFYAELIAPAALGVNRVFTLPGVYGASGDVLVGDGAGVLSWTNLSSTYVAVAGTSTVTGAKTFSGGLTAASLVVTGTTTLSTALTGLLKAAAGVVSAAVAADVTGQLLTGLGAGSNTAIVAGDSILGALANLQAQVTAVGTGPFVPVAGATSVTGLKTFSAGLQDSTLTVNRLMYAAASGRISTDSRYRFDAGWLNVVSPATIDPVFSTAVTGDSFARYVLHANGDQDYGPGATTTDVFVKRETFAGSLGISNSHTVTSAAANGVAFQAYAAVNTGTNVTGYNLVALNGSAAAVPYARLSASIDVNTAGAHTGRLVFQASKAGTMTAYAYFGVSGAVDGFNLAVGGLYVNSVLAIDASRNATLGTLSASSVTATGLTAGRLTTVGTAGLLQSDAGLTHTQLSNVTRLVIVGEHAVAGDTGYVIRRTATFAAKLAWQDTGSNTRWQLLMDDTINMRLGAYTSGAVFIDYPFDIVNASAGAIIIGGSTARPTTFTGSISGTSATFSGLTSGRVLTAGVSGVLTDYASFTYSVSGGHILTIGDGTSATARLDINGAVGTTVAIRMRQAGILRWAPLIDGATTRFSVVSYDSAGTEIDRPLEIQNASGGNIYLNRPTLVSTLTALQVLYAGTSGLLTGDAGFVIQQVSGVTRTLLLGDYATVNDVFYVARQTSGQLSGYAINDSATNRRWTTAIVGTDYRVGRWTNASTKIDDPIIIVAGSAGAITIGGSSNSPTTFTGAVTANQQIWATAAWGGSGQVSAGGTSQAGLITFKRGSDGGLTGSIGYAASATEPSELRVTANGGSGYLAFWTAGTEKARISTAGDWVMGGVTRISSTGAGVFDTLSTVGLATLAQAAVSDITDGRLVIATTGGRLRDSAKFMYNYSGVANLIIGDGIVAETSGLSLDAPAGNEVLISLRSANVSRWAVLRLATSLDFAISARNAAGVEIDKPLNIVNASAGLMSFGGSTARPATFTGALSVTGATTLATSLTGLLKATAGLVAAATAADVTGQLLTGFSVGSNTAIVAGDSILAAFGKTQGQIAAMTNFWSRASTTVSLVTSTDVLNLGTPTLTNGKLNIGGGSAGGSIVNSLSAGYRLLLHFDGNNGSRKILDSGSYATPIYSRGTQYYNLPVVSTTQSKFGTTSLRLDGTNYLEAASRFSIGTGDFSFDFHVYFTSVAGTQTIVDWGGAASGLVLTYSAGTWTFNVAGTATTFSNTPTVNTWYHIAVSRTSNSVRFWVAGTKTGTTQTASGSVTATNTTNMFIGATSAGANRSSFYMDEFRFVTGSSVYTSDAAITVPTIAYEPGGVRLAVDSTSRIPDNYVMACDGAGSFMPQRPPRLQVVTFCLGESVSNTAKYFYSDRALGTTQDDAQRSGNSSGMSFANACSPVFAGFTGRIVSAVLVVQGVGVNNGTVTYPVVYRADLFRVGFAAEHDPNINSGAAAQLNFSLPTGTTIGTFSVGAANSRLVLQDLNIPVFAGDPLALKFINGTGASGAAMTQMAFVTLVIEETF